MRSAWSDLKAKLDFPEIEWFVLVYDQVRKHRSIAEVRSLLKVDKSFLYRKIAGLEQKLWGTGGKQLIDRESGKGWSTCREGDAFYALCQKLLADREQALREFHTGQREVTLGTTHAILTFFLPRKLARSKFLESNTDIGLRIIQGEWNQLLDRLESTSDPIDFALGPRIPESPRFVLSQKLREIRRGLAIPKGHVLWDADAESVSLESLAEHVVFYIRSGMEPGSEVERLIPPPRGSGRRVILPNYADVKVMVSHGLGLGILYDQMVFPEDASKMRWMDLKGKLRRQTTHIYYPPGGHAALSEHAQRLARAIIEVGREVSL